MHTDKNLVLPVTYVVAYNDSYNKSGIVRLVFLDRGGRVVIG